MLGLFAQGTADEEDLLFGFGQADEGGAFVVGERQGLFDEAMFAGIEGLRGQGVVLGGRGSIFLDFVNLLVHFRIGTVGGNIGRNGVDFLAKFIPYTINLLIEHFYFEIYEFDLFT
jgi:hypothetical protein